MDPLTVPGRLDSLELIKHYVLDVAGKANLNHRETYRLRLAVDEISTNIITHGYANNDRANEITVQGFIKINKIIIQVVDHGIPFDPSTVFCPGEVFPPPEERSINGGLGIFLALSNVDHFYYETKKSFNRSTFVLYTKQTSP